MCFCKTFITARVSGKIFTNLIDIIVVDLTLVKVHIVVHVFASFLVDFRWKYTTVKLYLKHGLLWTSGLEYPWGTLCGC